MVTISKDYHCPPANDSPNTFIRSQHHEDLGLSTTEALAHRVLGQPHRWVAGRTDKGWWCLHYYPLDKTVSFSFLGRGLWFDMLVINLENARAKLEALGVHIVKASDTDVRTISYLEAVIG